MVQAQYSLSWSDYKSNICNGFSSLQQNGEMVDMTLAADGHIVKVHQVLLALASPYLKELITSAPCQHPVIFLNDVSYRTLTALLEYVYTGEVLVAAENLPTFVKTAKSLHIRGLEDLNVDYDNLHMKLESMSRLEDNSSCHISGTKRMIIPEIDGAQIDLPASARRVLIKRKKSSHTLMDNQNISMESATEDFPIDDTPADHDSDDNFGHIEHDIKPKVPITEAKETGQLQYSVSIRGSLQVILNRYIYNLQNLSRFGMRRWRCIDYRNRKCLAFLVTKGNIVLNRANLHNHPFHDKKILQKIEKKAVYSAITDVEGYKETEDDGTMEQDDLTNMSYDFDESADEANK